MPSNKDIAGQVSPDSSSVTTPRTVEPRYLYQQIALEIERYINDAGLAPGHALPSERDLVAYLGVSRQSLREAMRMLELVGLVERRRGGPSRVGQYDFALLASWATHSLPLREQTLHDLLPVRAILESGAASIAAVNITDEQLDALVSQLRETKQKIQGGATVKDLLDDDIAFHAKIFEAANNLVLSRLAQHVQGLLIEFRYQVLGSKGSTEHMLLEHEQILGALVRHDPDEAARAAGGHVQQVARLIRELDDTRPISPAMRRHDTRDASSSKLAFKPRA